MHLSGTLARQVQRGLDVTIAVACNGNLGGLPGAAREERAAVRRGEMERACAMLGVRLEWLGAGDDDFMERMTAGYAATERGCRDLVRRVDPDLILTHPLDDYHHHHRAAAELVLNASTGASNPSAPGDAPASRLVPYALHFAPMPPTPFAPAVYVDITATFALKLEALRCHASQHQYLRDHHRTDIFEQVEAAARLHGAACGVAYAEAFALCQRFNRVPPIHKLAEFFA